MVALSLALGMALSRLAQVSVFLLVLFPVAALSVPVIKYLPFDCEDIQRNGDRGNGVYTIYPGGNGEPVEVYCALDCKDGDKNEGRMWTVFQSRLDGHLNFYRPWKDYKNGFGFADKEHWLGLENIFHLTRKKKYKLLVEMEDFEKGKVHAQYSSFSIDSESEGYTLHIGSYVDGGAGDSMTYHNNMKFSTFDKDQDRMSQNCAQTNHGGFWYNSCLRANPNGLYTWGPTPYNTGVQWQTWKGPNYSLKSITMKIQSVSLDHLE